MDFSSEKEDTKEEGFDQVLQQLKQVVGRLEQGQLSLEQALTAFEEGIHLAKKGNAILSAAEHRVDVLMQTSDGGMQLQPLEKK